MLFGQMRNLFALATVEGVLEFGVQSRIVVIQLLYALVGSEPPSLCFGAVFLITKNGPCHI
jgi:hypothetical protein